MYKIDAAKMKILMWMCDKSMKNKIRNGHFQEHLRAAIIGNKIRETLLKWFMHV